MYVITAVYRHIYIYRFRSYRAGENVSPPRTLSRTNLGRNPGSSNIHISIFGGRSSVRQDSGKLDPKHVHVCIAHRTPMHGVRSVA